MRSALAWWLVPSLIVGAVCADTAGRSATENSGTAPNAIAGPYASLLAASEDLGPAREARVELTAALRDGSAPQALARWAGRTAFQ